MTLEELKQAFREAQLDAFMVDTGSELRDRLEATQGIDLEAVSEFVTELIVQSLQLALKENELTSRVDKLPKEEQLPMITNLLMHLIGQTCLVTGYVAAESKHREDQRS